MAPDRILKIAEAAEMLGVATATVYQYVWRKEIPHYKPNKKLLYFKESELIEWMTSRRIASSTELDQATSTDLLTRRAK